SWSNATASPSERRLCSSRSSRSSSRTSPFYQRLPSPAVVVTLYSRPGCGLCDEAREVILAERTRAAFDLEEVDITGDDRLELEYGIRIPVVLIDGRERFELTVDPTAFSRAISKG